MNRLRSLAVVAASASIAFAVSAGCGGVNDSSLSNDQNGGLNGGGKPGIGGEIDDKAAPVGDDLKKCLTSTAKGTLAAVNLVTMFDQSGSMGDDGTPAGNNKRTRWDPVTAGMKAFYSDPASAGMNASLQYFPLNDGSGQPVCWDYFYSTPDVALTGLPSADLVRSIDRHGPLGGTPTDPALRGAINYAKSAARARPMEATAVLLVTDGEPNSCSSTVDGVSALAAAGFRDTPSIPTYVIGVGPQAAAGGAIDVIAKAGGTGQGIHVDTNDPAKTTQDLVAALNKVRGQIISCSFGIPAPTDGKQLDLDAVNVVYTPTGGQPKTLNYSEKCDQGLGWHYDNRSAPKKIDLCNATCNTIRNDRSGQITIAYGCKTNVKIN
ncbi:hypothetical protein [Pendulispora albinea]|uniref:VWA domain-containing protein n=1 Tax=Pendulispora albinea TaxID=2741071 RepID=A0ABZ2LT99_9BACT